MMSHAALGGSGIGHMIVRGLVTGLARAEAYKIAGHMGIVVLGVVVVALYLGSRVVGRGFRKGARGGR
ncbi:MAG: hypothetical protein ACYDH6_16060 [Acidimicrobiales bacterium]